MSEAKADMARTPASTQADANRPLADTGSEGLARLRELEQLLATACQVRRLAETEIREGRNLERAEQRRDAAARMQRKVERELLRLRSELAGKHPEVNQVWTPGDPVGRKPRPQPIPAPAPASEAETDTDTDTDTDTETQTPAAPGDFELAVMLGTRRSRWQASTSDFSIAADSSPAARPAGSDTAARRPTPARAAAPTSRTGSRPDARPRHGGRGRLLTLVLVSALAGAGLSYLLSQSDVDLSAIIAAWTQAAADLLP
ncbi:uncharacterized protein FOKN1_0857 [Thiohalobacter thiocyanaticus]|uniref:Uncharacterized protein n=1 Tax=Thiohalobacter thiocyanaticus TaxID=585455 RepID=A0A1Z4VNR0_9GAMM|nr:hypothetical protein [Thiohalobacter thiocyanaticus]BAZ93259.1 uncharacterized protein FOKN1_0857 [Thiohalobacter thiocyanaticus]